MKKMLFLCIGCVFMMGVTQAKQFYFEAKMDHLLANPSNWSPSYPGTKVSKSDTVYILADAHFDGYTIEVSGEWQIISGFTLSSTDGKVKILSGGRIINYGSIITQTVDNFGRFDNGPASSLRTNDLITYPNSMTQNGIGSELKVARDFINRGEFQNYSECQLENLVNYSKIMLLMRSSMHVGSYSAEMGNQFLSSRMSHFCHQKGRSTIHTRSQALGSAH